MKLGVPLTLFILYENVTPLAGSVELALILNVLPLYVPANPVVSSPLRFSDATVNVTGILAVIFQLIVGKM